MNTTDKGRSTASLSERFTDFLNQLPGLESLDSSDIIPSGYSGDRADYAFSQLQVIVEMKSLERDRSAAVQKILEEYYGRRDFPIVYGELPLNRILENVSPTLREEINGRVLEQSTKTLERAFRKANAQIAATKDILGQPDAGGLLVVLNDDLQLYEPDVLEYEIRRLQRLESAPGIAQFAAINCVIAVSNAHYQQLPDGTPAFPFMMFIGRASPETDRTEALMQRILTGWASFEGAQIADVSTFPQGCSTRGTIAPMAAPEHEDDFGKQFWFYVVEGYRTGRFAEFWFKWMEWVLITAGINAVAVAADSAVLRVVAVFTGYTAMQHAIYNIETVATRLGDFVRPKQRWIRNMIISLLSLVALAMLFFVSYSLQLAVEHAGTLK